MKNPTFVLQIKIMLVEAERLAGVAAARAEENFDPDGRYFYDSVRTDISAMINQINEKEARLP